MAQLRISDLTSQPSPLVCGVINISPESFYSGSITEKSDQIKQKIKQMAVDGAKIIDIGALSTRPISLYGGKEITEDEELSRIETVLEPILNTCSELNLALSLDTQSEIVAKYGLESGIRVINEISGLNINPSLGSLIAEYESDVILMATHNKPGDIISTDDAIQALKRSISMAEDSGIERDRILIDPGFGGWQGRSQNVDLDLIHHFERFHELNLPIYIGVSRKSTISTLNGGKTPEERLIGSVILSNYLTDYGVRVIRTHDVKETVLGLEVHRSLRKYHNIGQD